MDRVSESLRVRPALSEELRFLARRHPRESWAGHANLGALARFWLQRHAAFRELDALIRSGSQDALDQRHDPDRLRPWLGRHLQLLLWQLEEHHQVEDLHYFPVFRRIEPRLAAGFEVLERDHAALHEALAQIVQRANAVLAPGNGDAAAFRGHLERYLDAQRALGRSLLRHLDDEEELVIPLLLERGEGALVSAAGVEPDHAP
jgi:iron-sulfur cluster repair protein YtfE (RIC family)